MSCKLKSSAYSFEIRSPGPLAPIFVRMSSTHKGTVVMAQKSHGTGFGFPHGPCGSPAILVLGGEFPSQGGVQAATMVQGWGKFHPKPAPGALQSRLIWKPRLFPASRLPSHRAKPRCPHTWEQTSALLCASGVIWSTPLTCLEPGALVCVNWG